MTRYAVEETTGELKPIYGTENESIKVDDMPKLIDAIDNLIASINNLSGIIQAKGNKYGY
jgi:hypothetical protein